MVSLSKHALQIFHGLQSKTGLQQASLLKQNKLIVRLRKDAVAMCLASTEAAVVWIAGEAYTAVLDHSTDADLHIQRGLAWRAAAARYLHRPHPYGR